MKTKFDSNYDLIRNKTTQVYNVTVVVRVVFHENNKYCLQDLLDECLY